MHAARRPLPSAAAAPRSPWSSCRDYPTLNPNGGVRSIVLGTLSSPSDMPFGSVAAVAAEGVACVAVNPVTLNRPSPLAGPPTSDSGTVQVILLPEILPGIDVVFGYVKYF